MSRQAEASTAMLHVKHLAQTIGPRGSTTPCERQAAEYAAAVMRDAGLEPNIEEFTSPVSGWMPFALAAMVALIVTVLLLLSAGMTGGRWFAALLGVVMFATTLSVFLEMYFRPNLLRPFVRKGPSRNVWAVVPAVAATSKVVLVAHLDTHRTPWVFTRPWRLRFFKAVTSLGVAAFVLAALVCLAFAATGWLWLVWLAVCLVPIHLVVLGLTLQPDTTPFTAGANDNATCFMANGVPSLSFVGLTPGGVIPDWHQVSDAFENVDPQTVANTEEFVWRLLRRLDARSGK